MGLPAERIDCAEERYSRICNECGYDKLALRWYCSLTMKTWTSSRINQPSESKECLPPWVSKQRKHRPRDSTIYCCPRERSGMYAFVSAFSDNLTSDRRRGW